MKKNKTKAVIILSGGLDSTTVLYKALREYYLPGQVVAISYNYGQNHTKELECASETCKRLGVEHVILNLSMFSQHAFVSALTGGADKIPEASYEQENMTDTVVPNRNMVMIAIAASVAISRGADIIYYGAHGGDHDLYPDCRPEFIEAMQNLLYVCHYKPIYLITPYMEWSKGEIVYDGVFNLNVPYENTWSCYKGGDKACGKCSTCKERLEAFRINGIEDPIQYEGEE